VCIHHCPHQNAGCSARADKASNTEQVETLLKTQDIEQPPDRQDGGASGFAGGVVPSANTMDFEDVNVTMGSTESISQIMRSPAMTPQEGFPAMQNSSSLNPSLAGEPFSWEMIGLGLEEPLPQQEVINEL